MNLIRRERRRDKNSPYFHHNRSKEVTSSTSCDMCKVIQARDKRHMCDMCQMKMIFKEKAKTALKTIFISILAIATIRWIAKTSKKHP